MRFFSAEKGEGRREKGETETERETGTGREREEEQESCSLKLVAKKKWQATYIAPLQPPTLAIFRSWGSSAGAGRIRPAGAKIGEKAIGQKPMAFGGGQ